VFKADIKALLAEEEAPNYKVKVTTHWTINANGEVTVTFVKAETTCK